MSAARSSLRPPAESTPDPARAGLRRRLLWAVTIYVALSTAFFTLAPREHLVAHSPHNHFALLADAWLQGRLDLGGPPPPYTGNNDFAQFGGKFYVSFPPFPAVLLLPVVALAGPVERVRDAQFFLWLAGIGPAVLFLALEKLRRTRRSRSSERGNAALAMLFGLGTVYWFTAVQGTVWFAAHVVGVALLALYVLFSLDAEHPLLAGLMLGLAVATRPSLGFALPLFCYEAFVAARRFRQAGHPARLGAVAGADVDQLLKRLTLFAAPAAAVIALLLWHNRARFGDPFAFGHRYLQVMWRPRIEKWGLFSYHYLGRNLGVVLGGVPFYGERSGLQINGHGLALWLTTPLYAWALWPRRTSGLYWAVALSAVAVALPALTYQNTGWIQFGYRFSNDFAPLLFLLIALGGRRFGALFWLVAAFCVIVNGFGALTFGKAQFARFYYLDTTQKVLFQPD